MKSVALDGKVVIVTGASRGIGRAIALTMADAGATVVVAARTVEEAGPLKGSIQKTAGEIIANGGQALPVRVNIGDEEDVGNMVQKVLHELGHIDILVNNAATNIPRYFKDVTLKQWDIITRITLRGVIVCSKAVLPSMMTQRYGHIINISSAAAVSSNDPLAGLAYDVSKAGVNRFTWGLAEEIKEYGIAVNALMPENTATEGWVMINPDADKSNWQTPEMWGRFATFVATRDPVEFTGKLLTTSDLEQEIGRANWVL